MSLGSTFAIAGVVLLGLSLALGAAQTMPSPSTAPTVEQWGVFDRAFSGPATGNPFVDVEFSAQFTCGQQTVTVPGFYDGQGEYRIRFMPGSQGDCKYTTQSNCKVLSGLSGGFRCIAPTGENHGPVRVRGTYHFAYADGKPFVPIGTTCYAFVQEPEEIEEQTLATLRSSPFNKVRMCLLPTKDTPLFYPYDRDTAGKFDSTRFNPEFFRHVETRIQQLGQQGVEADVILFHPYEKGALKWFDDLDSAADERYLRYAVARLSAYRNVWWSLANEYGQVKHKTEADWDHFFQVVQTADPYGHLRSIHNAAKFYDSNKPWVTHASVQNGSAVADFGRAVLYRELCPKPLVYDEVCYEGNIDRRWGHLTGREMVERFWFGTIAGTYVGHGETFGGKKGISWTGGGGELLGESPPRIAFLKKILEAGPPEGIEPIDETYETHFGGRAGKYYLVYFGREKPTSWTFALPRDPPEKAALLEGMKFRVDALDTWNMTITPVDRVFTTGKLTGAVFPAVGDAVIALPGTTDMALRIELVAADGK
jgi:hypothetical protein